MSKISIIVPVYNDFRYISRCLESLINQTYKNIEIIVVDDGSTDSTPSILQDYANKDSRIKVITQKNQKQGAARNNGLNVATGDYITFIDSDDWIDLDFCQKSYDVITKHNVDIALTSAIRIKENGKFRTYFNFKEETKYDGFNDIAKVNRFPGYWQVWGKLYKRELLEGIKFEEGVFYEDPEYLIKVLYKAKTLATVVGPKYYYFSNPNSTIKAKHNIAKRIDQVSSMEKVYKFSKENNIKFNSIEITKNENLFLKEKIYTDKKEYYLFGVKVYTKKEEYNLEKTILVFNTACFGDVLLCNPLCQNLKNIYPDAKIIFIVNKPFYDVAKYQAGVDDVVIYDKKGEHKGFFGLLKFVKNFKYKNIFASFITYKNERNNFIARLLKSKYILNPKKNIEDFSMQERHCKMLDNFTNKTIVNYPMKYLTPNIEFNKVKNKLNLPEEYIVLCAISKNPPKDMPLETTLELIKKINNESNLKIVLVGAGKATEEYANCIDYNKYNFVNAIGKTTIPELAVVLKNSKCLISVDTGTMHFGFANKVPTVAVFYEQTTVKPWSPNPEIYNSILINKDQTAENILNAAKTLLEDKAVNV